MRPDVIRRLKIFFVATGIFLVVAAIADHLVLPGLVNNRTSHGLLFPPGSEFPYQTPEFSHTAKINSLGFRDREWATDKKEATTRIVAIGDSFTFGMGVELDRTWTKVLEQRLKARGFDVEIANLGRPGAHPASYAEVAQKAVPLLKPDVLLVAVLQGDDLAQTIGQIKAEETAGKKTAGAAEMIVLSIPLGMYVSETVRQGGDEIGFTTFPEMLLTTKPDESLKKICDESGIAFLSVTEAFRRQSRDESLYYTYDGHFTPQGHELFVREILPLLQKLLLAKEGG